MLEHVSDTISFNSQTRGKTIIKKLFFEFFLSRIAAVALLIIFFKFVPCAGVCGSFFYAFSLNLPTE